VSVRRWNQRTAAERSVTDRLAAPFAAQFARLFDDLAEAGFMVQIPSTGGVRSTVEQSRIYSDSLAAGGGNRLDRVVGFPGTSLHEYGLAADLMIVGANGKRFADGPYGRTADPYYTKIGAFVRQFPDLRWGGEFGDRPHVEWRHIEKAPMLDSRGQPLIGIRTNGTRYRANKPARARFDGRWVPIAPVTGSSSAGAPITSRGDAPVVPVAPSTVPIYGGDLDTRPTAPGAPVTVTTPRQTVDTLPGPRLQPRRTVKPGGFDWLWKWLGWNK
jgi:hypothetical protein